MKNILVATDLSPNCDRAMARAFKLAAQNKAKLHMIHVPPNYHFVGMKKQAQSLRDELAQSLKDYLTDYATDDDVKSNVIISRTSNAYEEIIAAGEEVHADLIVMGLHNKSGLIDMFVGTTIERVIRKGIKPVLMVKDKPRAHYSSLVSGVDFSGACSHAFTTALQLSPGAKVSLVHSFDFPDSSNGHKIEALSGEVIERLEVKQMDAFVKQHQKSLKKFKVTPKLFKYSTVKGDPAKTLIKQVKSSKANLLAVGVNARAGLGHLKLGGITAQLLIDPPCDVLVSKGY
ncbi:MAG: nucleotide-binding universal stress UspA family protein [Candidatus Azotimanducaceae bacterium]|jgi:universal stress protein E